MTQATENKIIRRSIVCTFKNHAPVRFWGEFDAAAIEQAKKENKYGPGDRIYDYTEILWDAVKDSGHHTILYYICKSGKRIYFCESYGLHQPKTTRTYLKDKEAIHQYFLKIEQEDQWFKICGIIDPTMIVDSDML